MHMFNSDCDPWYVVRLWDYATPAFVSADKQYLGSRQEMLALAGRFMALAQEHKGGSYESGQRFAESIERYFSGSESEKNTLVYGDYPLFEKARLIGMDEHHIKHGEYTHQNIYGFDYKMRFAQCLTEHYVVQQENVPGYCVYSRFSFINLNTYSDFLGMWSAMDYARVSNREVLCADESDEQSRVLSTALGLEDASFDTLEEADAYISSPDNINYKTVFDDIFGDT